MARKRKAGNGSAIYGLVVIVVFVLAGVPKQVWIGLGIVVALSLLMWLLIPKRKNAQSTGKADKVAPASRSLRNDSVQTTSVPPVAPLPLQETVAQSGSEPELFTVSIGTNTSTGFSVPDQPAYRPTTTFKLPKNDDADRLRESVSADSSYLSPVQKQTFRSGTIRWLGASEPACVAGLTLPGGLLYLSDNGGRAGYEEPSLIDLSLPIMRSAVDITVRLVPYWPAYWSMSSEARRAYLQWQASGRSDPEADIGYVFLFFYGLEKRALIEAPQGGQAHQDLPAIKQEVTRLLSLYSGNASFRGYATRFLSFLDFQGVTDQSYLTEPTAPSYIDTEPSLELRIALGQMATDKRPLSARWALAWALSDPNISKRTPVSRCLEQFCQLFEIEYENRYSAGIVLTKNKTKLKITYQPASSALTVPNKAVGDLPDVMATSVTRNKLQLIVDACTTVLEPYSRYVGRNPGFETSLEGLLQLPLTLWPAEARAELNDLGARLTTDVLVMSFGELSGRFKSAGALSRDKVSALARAFESQHIGMEPDVLYGAKTPKSEDLVALFAINEQDGTLRTTDDYQAAMVTLDLAIGVAAADGEASMEELKLLASHIDSWTHLCPSHRKRLNARLQIQLKQPPTLASIKKKLEPLTQVAKRKIAGFLAHLAQADGAVTTDEIRLLEKVYKALLLDAQLLYGDLHMAGAQAQQTNWAKTAAHNDLEQSVVPSAVPSQTLVSAGHDLGLKLDMTKVAQLQRETAEVSALLASVFTDEVASSSAETSTTTAPQEASSSELYGLDGDHSALLRLLVSRPTWTRAELEDVAADMDLMLDGSLERLNDMAFDQFDMPLTEGDEPVEINPEILSELTL